MGINDLKKVYNHLADERLKELKNLVLNSHQQFKDVYNEIEQILEMDTNNIDELESIWQGLKSAESNLTKYNYGTRSANESLNKSSDSLLIDDETEAMERNIEKIHAINRKKREEIEAAQRAIELAAAQEEEEEARQRQIIADEQMQLEQQEPEPIIIDSVMSVEAHEQETIEIKIEQNIPIETLEVESKPKSPKLEQTEIKPETINNDLDKSSSEDEVPLVKLHQKNKKKDSETGIEWKPVVDNTTDETNNQLKLSLLTDDENESDEELSVKKPKRTFSSPRKQLKVVESSSSSSDTETKTVTNTPVVESPKNKVEEIQQPTPVALLPSRKSTRNRNSLSTSSNKEANKNDESDLIFTPLIKYDKKEDSEKPEQITKIDENEEINSQTSDKDEKESVSGLISVVSESKNRRKSKNVKKIEIEPESNNETKTETDEMTLNISDEEETTEEQTTRVSTLRSKRTGLLNNSNQYTSKRRSSSIQKVTKSLIVSVNTPKTNRSLLSPKTITTDDLSLNEMAQNKDAGLLSIKCEPMQISASSTVQDSDLKEENESSVLVTRSSRNKDSAPFSSSSTSSILSNNSSSSLINKFEDEKAYRAWKKSILMVLNNIACHKYYLFFIIFLIIQTNLIS